MPDKERIGANLVRIRKRLGMNQSEFARELKINRNGLYLYESGKRIVSSEAMLKIYKRFGITPNEIFGLND